MFGLLAGADPLTGLVTELLSGTGTAGWGPYGLSGVAAVVALAMLTGGPTDAELVQRFRDGDTRAYEEIVRRYQHRVYTLAYRWMGDERLAEEVAQDVFLALYRSLARFRGDSKLSTYVYRVVVNHSKNRRSYRERRKVDHHEPLEGLGGEDDRQRQLPSDGPGADSGANRSEAEAILREALDAMDADQRQIVILRDVEDLSYDEIAQLLEIPRGTVKSRLHRARAQLAQVLRGRVSEEDVL